MLDNYLLEIQTPKVYYHGSPKDLKILEPQQGKGRNSFENLKAVFLTKTFLHSALYAIGKTLKGKTPFGVSKTKLVILGNLEPGNGYVYEISLNNTIKGPDDQYAYQKNIIPTKKIKVYSKDFKKNIFYVTDMQELIKTLEVN